MDDTRYLTLETIDAYLEMVCGVMALRLPLVQRHISADVPEFVLYSSYANEHLVINSLHMMGEMKKEGLKNVKSLDNSINQVNKIFLSSMWDTLKLHKQYQKISTEPDIQYFRHMRNACAHNNTLNFKGLKYPAKWREREIKQEDSGSKIFPGFLSGGDVMLLMMDIDKKYFEQLLPPK